MNFATPALFTDGSYAPIENFGIGGYLFCPLPVASPLQSYEVHLKEFTQTTNTALELQTLLWAIDNVVSLIPGDKQERLHIYTDCKTAVDLLARRPGLEKKAFKSQRTGKELSNASLYREFYSMYDQVGFEMHWLKGHRAQNTRTVVDELFRQVDQAVRKQLRVSIL